MPATRHHGGTWLVEHLGTALVQPLPVRSQIGGRTPTSEHTGERNETNVPSMDPGYSVRTHLEFFLKHESMHLKLLARVFDAIDPQVLAQWVRSKPTDQYARRAGFLYEWLTGHQLPLNAQTVPAGNYVDALDPEKVLVATRPVINSRWRVRDNMPGTPDFCPIVRWTGPASVAAHFDVAAALNAQEAIFGAEVIRRSAAWMTLKESRSSLLIDGGADHEPRIRRFAAVLDAQTGEGWLPLTCDALTSLQASVLGAATTLHRFGLRRSPVFVGEARGFNNVAHYVAPPWPSIPGMLQGLERAIERTDGQPQRSVPRAAVAAFGFAYIHPLADGNGRSHRFLVNDILRRDGVLQAPFILPISALITESSMERTAYDGALEIFSKPLIRRYAAACHVTNEGHAEAGGVKSNFRFQAYDAAMPAWRFQDLTDHVTYLGGVLERTISQEVPLQAARYRAHDLVRRHVKELLEGPDTDIDAIIQSAQEREGKLSEQLKGRFPVLERPGLWPRIADAVTNAFGDQPDAPGGRDTQPPANA